MTIDVTEPRNGPPEGALGIRLQGDGHWGVRVGEWRQGKGWAVADGKAAGLSPI